MEVLVLALSRQMLILVRQVTAVLMLVWEIIIPTFKQLRMKRVEQLGPDAQLSPQGTVKTLYTIK